MRILFVCHGNICRSPMAELVLKDMLKGAGIANLHTVDSAATSDEEIFMGVGNPVYPPVRALLRKKGIDTEGKRARQLVRDDYDRYDLIFGMDGANMRNMRAIFGSDPECKVRKLLTLVGEDGDVFDPWYTGMYEEAYKDIYRACKALFDTVRES